MRNAAIIPCAKAFGKQLQGESNGKKHYARAWDLLSDAAAGDLVLLDFKGVDVTTGSWINAMIVPFYRRAMQSDIDLYPVCCGVTQECMDDLALLAKWTHQCYLVADKCIPSPRAAKIIGTLDQGQKDTLKLVLEYGAVTGAELERKTPRARIGPTAWNNRLKDLHEKRLLRRVKRGREQVYSPVVEVIETDG